MTLTRCLRCGKRIWFWQKWEFVRSEHCELIDGWACSRVCWSLLADEN